MEKKPETTTSEQAEENKKRCSKVWAEIEEILKREGMSLIPMIYLNVKK